MLLAVFNAICILVFSPKSGISVWLCSLWELFHPSCFASPLPQAILSWHLIFLSPWCALWEHCSLGILHHQLCSPYLLLLLSSLQAVLTRSRHRSDGFDLKKKKQPSSPFLLLMEEEDEQVWHLSDVLYFLPSCFIAIWRVSEENSIQVTSRVASGKDPASSEFWGQLFARSCGQGAHAVPACQGMELL